MLLKYKSWNRKGISPSIGISYLERGRSPKHPLDMVIYRNIDISTPKGAIEQLKAQVLHQKTRKNQRYFGHLIGAFHKNSLQHLTPEKLRILIDKTIHEIGLENTSLYCAVHIPKSGSAHFHAFYSVNEYQSETNTRISRKDFLAAMGKVEIFQKENFPELNDSLVSHKMRTEMDVIKTARNRRKQNKAEINRRTHNDTDMVLQINYCISSSNDGNEFIRNVSECGLHVYQTKSGKIAGVIDKNGKKFRWKKLQVSDTLKRLQGENNSLYRERRQQLERVQENTKQKQKIRPEL